MTLSLASKKHKHQYCADMTYIGAVLMEPNQPDAALMICSELAVRLTTPNQRYVVLE